MHLKTSLALALFALLLARVQAGISPTSRQSTLPMDKPTSPTLQQSTSPKGTPTSPTSQQSTSPTRKDTSPTWSNYTTAVPWVSTTPAPRPICMEYGYCVGDSLDVRSNVPSEKACLADCQLLSGCNFYSFEDGFCNLLRTCELVHSCSSNATECSHGSKDCVACSFPGMCQGGTQTASHTLPDEASCMEQCHGTEKCEWFSFETKPGQDHGSCKFFQHCVQFKLPAYAGSSNITITSGASSCVPPTCFVPGECHAHMYKQVKANDAQACLEECTYNCRWFTYYKEAGMCALFDEECALLDADGCDDCVTGQRECSDH